MLNRSLSRAGLRKRVSVLRGSSLDASVRSLSAATAGKWVRLGAAALACLAVAACGNDDAGLQSQQSAAERTPQLAGALGGGGHSNALQAPLLAQGFDTPKPSMAAGASAPPPLLPPVIHTAD